MKAAIASEETQQLGPSTGGQKIVHSSELHPYISFLAVSRWMHFEASFYLQMHAKVERVVLAGHVVQKLGCASSAKQVSDVYTGKSEDAVQILCVCKIVLSIYEPLVVKYLNYERPMQRISLSRHKKIEARNVACRYEGANMRLPQARLRDCKMLEALRNVER